MPNPGPTRPVGETRALIHNALKAGDEFTCREAAERFGIRVTAVQYHLWLIIDDDPLVRWRYVEEPDNEQRPNRGLPARSWFRLPGNE